MSTLLSLFFPASFAPDHMGVGVPGFSLGNESRRGGEQ